MIRRHFLLFSLLLSALAARAAGWTPTVWNNEQAWQSTHHEWTAIVSAERARLIFMGPTGGENLLYAPRERQGWWWGGHLCWFGPQDLWGWPPPRDLDHSAAARVLVIGDMLRVVHPWTDPAYPPAERDYYWSGDRLVCQMCWADTPRTFCAIQILEVPEDSVVDVAAHPSKALPQGYAIKDSGWKNNVAWPTVQWQPGGTRLQMTLPHDAITLGFPDRPLTTHRKGYSLTVSTGPIQGKVISQPNHGWTTVIWSGNFFMRFLELEQFSPMLQPRHHRASFTTYITPGHDPVERATP